MMAVLILATVLLFTSLRTDLRLTTVESSVPLADYLLFVVRVVAEIVCERT